MPLYAYRCTQCGYSFEKIQNFSSKAEEKCPECGGKLERPLTAPGLSFKGAGWYVNDYAGKSKAPTAPAGSKPEGGSTTTETKTASGGESGAASPAPTAPASSSSSGSSD